MDLITKLLSSDAPANTIVESWDLTFRGFMPAWLAILVFLFLVGLIGLLYAKERGKLSWPARIGLASLRLAVLGLLLFLLARPILLVVFQGERARSIPVLVDISESMTYSDQRQSAQDKKNALFALGRPTTDLKDVPNPRRIELVQGMLDPKNFHILDDLQKKGPVRPYLFGSHLRGVQARDAKGSDPAMLLKQELADKWNHREELKKQGDTTDPVFDSTTAMTDAIHEILNRRDDDLPAALVLMTDGQDNAGKYSFAEIGRQCKDRGVPLHIYGVGTAEGLDLKLKEVNAPETLFAEDNLQLPIRFRAQGLPPGSKVNITVTLDGATVKTKEVEVQDGDDLREVLEFVVPKGKDAEESRKLQVTISHKGLNLSDELPGPTEVRVVDRKIRVLYIEHSPRFEYRYLQPALIRDRRVDPSFILVSADPQAAKSDKHFLTEFPPTREKFFDAKFNVIIIGDVAMSYFGREKLEWIKEFVENRGGLIALAGRQNMPSSYENSPIADLLPIDFVAQKSKLPTEERTLEYNPTLTDLGERMPMMSLGDTPEENRETWKKLPGFFWQYPITKLKPSGLPLLTNPRAKMGEDAMPIAATHYYGKGQVLFMGTDETWRWRSVKENKYFIRFWGQIIYQLGLPSLLGETAKRAQFSLERSEAFLGQPSSIYVRLLDKEYLPRKDKEVEATLRYKDGVGEQPIKVKLTPVEGREGDYRALLSNERKGAYELTVNNPDEYSYHYRVKVPPGHELSESAMNERGLKELAETTGGGYYHEEDLPKLAEAVKPQMASFKQRQEILLWNPLMLLVFLALITAEWVARKFANLS